MMSHAFPIHQDREAKLFETIFEYINRLGKVPEGEDITDKDESKFQRRLGILAKCPSFTEGSKNHGYSTVLHKAITMFKLSKVEQYDANGSAQERGNELAPDWAQVCVQERVLHYIITTYPELLHCHRDNSPKFCGQTRLHMAISKENKVLVQMLLNAARKQDAGGVKELLSQNATGLCFKNNVMMGQLPLSIAVLTDNKDIVKLLLEQNETDVYQQNSVGDNLCHSLLNYVNIFPDREVKAKEMMQFIKDEMKHCFKTLLLMVNENKETPLILAAKYGQVKLFDYIIDELKIKIPHSLSNFLVI